MWTLTCVLRLTAGTHPVHFEHEDMSLDILKLIIDRHAVPITAPEYELLCLMISDKRQRGTGGLLGL